jgi:hypothetical protein
MDDKTEFSRLAIEQNSIEHKTEQNRIEYESPRAGLSLGSSASPAPLIPDNMSAAASGGNCYNYNVFDVMCSQYVTNILSCCFDVSSPW